MSRPHLLRHRQFQSQRKSTWIPPEFLPEYYINSTNVGLQLLSEDLYQGMVPSQSSRNQEAEVAFVPSPPPSTTSQSHKAVVLAGTPVDVVRLALDWDDQSYDLKSAYTKFLQRCVFSIAHYKETFCELAVMQLNESDSDISVKTSSPQLAIEFVHLQPYGLYQTRKGWEQNVPLSLTQERDLPQKVLLDRNDVLRFGVPTEYRQEWEAILSSIKGKTSAMGPRFAKLPFPPWFDHFHFTRTQKLAQLSVTRHIGYDHRMVYHSDVHKTMTEYYLLRRQLTFRRFQIQLRDEVTSVINEGLRRAEDLIGPLGQIELKHFPSLSDVDAAQSELEQGVLNYNQLMRNL